MLVVMAYSRLCSMLHLHVVHLPKATELSDQTPPQQLCSVNVSCPVLTILTSHAKY